MFKNLSIIALAVLMIICIIRLVNLSINYIVVDGIILNVIKRANGISTKYRIEYELMVDDSEPIVSSIIASRKPLTGDVEKIYVCKNDVYHIEQYCLSTKLKLAITALAIAAICVYFVL